MNRHRRDPISSLVVAIEMARPFALIIYQDFQDREEWTEELAELIPRDWRRVGSVEEALSTSDEPLVLIADDESQLIRLLAGRREAFIDREGPIVIFLLANGSGLAALMDHPGLASWLRASEVDPEALTMIDVVDERRWFEESTGKAPEAWLAKWRAGELPDTLTNELHSHTAAMLTGE